MKKKILICMLLAILVGFSFNCVYAARIGADVGNGEVYCSGEGIEEGNYKSSDVIITYCGLPAGLTQMFADVYDLLKIAVPVVLIIMGMIDLLKAVASQKEEEIKKGWQKFVKRTLIGMLVFFVVFIVQLVIDLLPDSHESVTNCVKCIFLGTNEEGCNYESIVIGNSKPSSVG